MSAPSNRPKVGVGVLLFNDAGHLLLGQRKGAHGEDTWGPPGGHLEFGATLEGCAGRELLEETGVRAKDFTFVGLTNDVFERDDKHYISLFMRADLPPGQEIVNCEPDKTRAWQWFAPNVLPEHLFLPLASFMARNVYSNPHPLSF